MNLCLGGENNPISYNTIDLIVLLETLYRVGNVQFPRLCRDVDGLD